MFECPFVSLTDKSVGLDIVKIIWELVSLMITYLCKTAP